MVDEAVTVGIVGEDATIIQLMNVLNQDSSFFYVHQLLPLER